MAQKINQEDYNKRVAEFKTLLSVNTGVKRLADLYNLPISRVITRLFINVYIYYYKNGNVKEIKIDYFDSGSTISVKEKLTFFN